MANLVTTLSEEQKKAVQRKAKGTARPSYFDASLAEVARRSAQANVPTEVTETVQISEDLEAVLILLPPASKQQLLSFLQFGLQITQDPTELEWMSEVVSVRVGNYASVNADAVSPQQDYKKAKETVTSFLESIRVASGVEVEDLVPDLDRLFFTLNVDVEASSRPEVLSLHNHITDTLTIVDTVKGADHQKEVLSWINIFKMYI